MYPFRSVRRYWRSLAAAAILGCSMTPLPAVAQIFGADLVDDAGVVPQDMVRLLQKWGYTAELKTDQQGEMEIVSTLEGLTYVIFFYDCNRVAPGKCLSYQFWAGFRDLDPPITLGKLNEWNEKQRWTTCSTEGTGRVRLKMSVNPRGALLEQNFRNWLTWWQRSLADFKKHINFRT